MHFVGSKGLSSKFSGFLRFCGGVFLLFCFLSFTYLCSQPVNSRFLIFSWSVNPSGHIDLEGKGYYSLLFNREARPIEVTNPETFTDFVRFDGSNFLWYHRQDNVPPPGYSWILAGNINRFCQLAADGRKIIVLFNLDDPSLFFNQYLSSPLFTAQVATSDITKNAILGRALDTMGAGPDFLSNSLNTVLVSRIEGAVAPLPPFYPMDLLNDWAKKEDLAKDFPYKNFDLFQFEIELR